MGGWLDSFRLKIRSRAFLALVSRLRKLSPRSKVVLRNELELTLPMDYQRHPILLSIESEIERTTRVGSCAKEPETVQWIEENLKPGDAFYDIGANVGAYSLVAAKFTNGQATTYAFEPAFPTFHQLCRNILLNRCEESVVPLPIALSDRVGLAPFFYSSLVPAAACHSVKAAIDHHDKAFTPAGWQSVLSFSLDELIDLLRLRAPNLVKMDVDGHEPSIFEGGKKTFSNPELRSVFVEMTEDSPSAEAIRRFLDSKGFGVHSRHEVKGGGPGMYNTIFQRH